VVDRTCQYCLHNIAASVTFCTRFSSVTPCQEGWFQNTSPASVNKIIEGRLISACQMSQVQRENRRGELNLSCIYADPACQLLVSVTVRDSKCQSTL